MRTVNVYRITEEVSSGRIITEYCCEDFKYLVESLKTHPDIVKIELLHKEVIVL
jgi:hypothetical protein